MNKNVVLVTGASSGIGSSICEEYAKNGYNVVINYNNNIENANILKEKLEKNYNVKCLCLKADISNDNEVQNMFNQTIKEFDHIDVLVNNAGISCDSLIEDKTKEKFMRVLEVNTYGTFLVSKIVGNHMYERKQGSIINISSTNAIDSYYEFSLEYDASKAAIVNMNHNLANIYAPFVRVNCVCPGWVDTPMNKNLSNEFKEEEINKTLLHRFADPSEIASLAYFLSSDKASYINDSVIRIDGGKKC
jgi:3-oxoacyl-[acyl-carrier protein] reductase